jgi:high-affinity iron transporter
MFLDAVILILGEILEASLLFTVLLTVNQRLSLQSIGRKLSMYWYVAAMSIGLLGAVLYAWAMPIVSLWFEYVGQEVTNALMQVLIILCLYLLCLLLQPCSAANRWRRPLAGGLLIVVIAFGITREASEIMLYLHGITSSLSAVMPVLLGAGVAAGIGLSTAILLYYALLSLAPQNSLRSAMILLALFAGNMASQAVQSLTQADWLPYTQQLWDSSAVLAEYSVSGQLLYALIGYEATPSLLQVVAYCMAMLLIISAPLFRHSWHTAHHGTH